MRAAEMLAAIRSLPVGSIADAGDPLVLAPHPDDESLGCGGLIGLLSDAGRPPPILFVTDGSHSHPGSAAFPAGRLRRVREREALEAASILGVPGERVRFLGLPDGSAPTAGPLFEGAVMAIGQIAAELRCNTVLSSWRHDPHGDHVAVHAMAAASGLRVLSYPVWGWLVDKDTELDGPDPAGFRLPVGMQLERKRRAIAAHASQAGQLIDDDPAGFRLPQVLLDACTSPFEYFIEAAR